MSTDVTNNMRKLNPASPRSLVDSGACLPADTEYSIRRAIADDRLVRDLVEESETERPNPTWLRRNGRSLAIAVLATLCTISAAEAQLRFPTRQGPMMQMPMYRPMPYSTPQLVPPSYRPLPWNPAPRIMRYGIGQALIGEGLPTAGRLIRGGPLTGVAGALFWPNVAR